MGRHKVRTVRARNNEWVRVVRSGSGGGGGGGGDIGVWLMLGGIVLGCCILSAIVEFIASNWIVLLVLVGLGVVGHSVLLSKR